MNNKKTEYVQKRNRYLIFLFVGIALLAGIITSSLCIGAKATTVREVFDALFADGDPVVAKIVTLSRIPRLIASLFVGAALSIAGLVYQDLFSNRMASPDVLGVSAGAGVGASIAIFLGLPMFLTSSIAFVGGLAAVLLTVFLSKLFQQQNGSISLILSGIVTGGLMSSALGVFKYLASDAQLSSITFWLLGGFYNVTYQQLRFACPAILIGIVALLLLRWQIVMMQEGDAEAQTHGVNVKTVRALCIIVTTVITSVSICISGSIGWIGLAIPNLIRVLMKNDGKYLMPLSIVYGSLFTACCDLFARTLTNTEVPVGIISGLLGAVIFVIVLLCQKRKGVTL